MLARSMLERLARALCKSNGGDPDALCGVPGCEVAWKLYLDDASAAIREMRTPTSKMLKAACAAMSPGKRPTQKRVSERAKHGIRYRAMIDAELGAA